MRGRIWVVLGALLAGAAVALGAYHAHGLHDWLAAQPLSPELVARRMNEAATAVRYQMYHALGLMLIGILLTDRSSRALHFAASLMLLGMVGFCGGLYWIVFRGPTLHWAIVPTGGLALILAWLVTAVVAGWPAKPRER